MTQNGAMKFGDIMLLWGVILTMMGLLSIIQMGIMENLGGFVLTGIICVALGLTLFIGVIQIDKKKTQAMVQ